MIPLLENLAFDTLDFALRQITEYWDWIKQTPASELPQAAQQLAQDWTGFGVSLDNLLEPRITLFFKSSVGDTLLDAYQVPLWLKALAPDMVGNVNLLRIPSRPTEVVLNHQLAQPGAAIEGDAVGVASGAVVGSENGTLGVFLQDNQSPPNIWALSANHVIGFNNGARCDNRFTTRVILGGQGTISEETRVVCLHESPAVNIADAAIAKCKPSLQVVAEIPGLPIESATPATAPASGTVVTKVGAASSASTGLVAYHANRLEINLSGLVGIDHCQFQDQYLIRSEPSGPFSVPGDSGALVTTVQNGARVPFGLLIAYQENPDGVPDVAPADKGQAIFSVVTPIANVISELESATGLQLRLLL